MKKNIVLFFLVSILLLFGCGAEENIEQTKANELVLETDDEIIVVSDFLLEDEKTDEWELDPAKALGVSGDDISVEFDSSVTYSESGEVVNEIVTLSNVDVS